MFSGAGAYLPIKENVRSVHFLLKFLYFIIWVAVGSFFPFISVYYYDIGLTGTQIGVIGMVNSLIGAISATLWGMFYDRTGRLRLMLAITCLGGGAACLLLARADSFMPILLSAALMNFFVAPALPLLDSLTVRTLGQNSSRYGEYRLWGTVGFMVTSSTAGYLFDWWGMSVMFYIYAIGLVFFMLIGFRLGNPAIKLSSSPLAGLKNMMRQTTWLVFAASIFLLWLATSGAISFLGVFVKQMGGTAKLVGLASTVAAATEIPLLLKSSWLLNRFGARNLTSISFAMYSVRLLLYSMMPAPEWAPWINLINGFSYIPFLIGTVAYANELAPENLKSSSIGLLTTVLSLAGMVGILVGGWLFDSVGPNAQYRILAVVCLAAFGLFWLGLAYHQKRLRAETS